MTRTDSTTVTVTIDEQGLCYVRWCDQVHRTIEDWLHCHCRHEAPLLRFTNPDTKQVLYSLCGKVFQVE